MPSIATLTKLNDVFSPECFLLLTFLLSTPFPVAQIFGYMGKYLSYYGTMLNLELKKLLLFPRT